MGVPKLAPERVYDARKITVCVEGQDDKRLLDDVWLVGDKVLHSNVTVRTPSENPRTGDGCMQVKKFVDQNAGTYGILDRDVFRTEDHLDLFLEADDMEFRSGARNTLPPCFHVLLHHEIENYLLQNQVNVGAELFTADKSVPPASVPTHLLKAADHYVEIMAAEHACIAVGKRLPKDVKALAKNPNLSIAELRALLHDELAKMEIQADSFDNNVRRLMIFAEKFSTEWEQWTALNRIVPGKDILSHLHTAKIMCGNSGSIKRRLAYLMQGAPAEIVSALLGFLKHAEGYSASP